MRFFTTVTPAGRLEYFLVAVVLNVITYAAAVLLFELTIDPLTQEITYAADKLAVMLFIYLGVLVLTIINALRRMKDLHMASGWIVLLLVPLVNIVFQLMLLFSSGVSNETYTPYGDNPYDPNSWVAPSASAAAGTPAVTFRGEALLLPGEEEQAA